MELWNKARSFAEEASKRSQDLSLNAHKFTEIIAETTKGIAAQAQTSMHLAESSSNKDVDVDFNLESFGITDELREFIRGITVTTFRDFPLQGFILFLLVLLWRIRLGLNASVLNYSMFIPVKSELNVK